MRWGGSRMSRGVGSHFISPDDVVGVTYVGMGTSMHGSNKNCPTSARERQRTNELRGTET
jgi:hypothetical protein